MTPEQELDILARILAGLRRPATPSPQYTPPSFGTLPAEVAQAFLIGILILMLLVLGWFAWAYLSGRAATRKARRKEADIPATSVEALEQATVHAVEGDMRLGMRQLYLATLLLLDERGILPFDRTLTNREILRALRPKPELAGALAPVVDAYDPAWYGHKSISRDEFDAFKNGIEHAQKISEPPPPEPAPATSPTTPLLPTGGGAAP
jgi:hypothetical protein